MTPSADYVFPDTTVIRTFAAVGEQALLRQFLSGRGKVTEAVAAEIRRQRVEEPGLVVVRISEWFGHPVRVDDVDEIEAVERMRRFRFGGRLREPLKHLGESETLVVLERPEHERSVWLTDDHDAYNVAVNQRIATRHTVEVLIASVKRNLLSAEDAIAVHGLMLRSGRHPLGDPAQLRSLL